MYSRRKKNGGADDPGTGITDTDRAKKPGTDIVDRDEGAHNSGPDRQLDR